jgi:hypothetical protein
MITFATWFGDAEEKSFYLHNFDQCGGARAARSRNISLPEPQPNVLIFEFAFYSIIHGIIRLWGRSRSRIKKCGSATLILLLVIDNYNYKARKLLYL